MDKKTILIVDDIDSNRAVLRKMLLNFGYIVVEADSGQMALDRFRESPPDVVLMDINMPDINGHEASLNIKRLAGDEYVPVIFVTALSSDESLVESLDYGDDFISKPVDMYVLLSKIKVHLRIRELNRKLEEQNKLLEEKNREHEHEKELIDHFFDNALQQSYLDESLIKFFVSPMAKFNGDVLMAERRPDGVYQVLLGDFTGHGLAAAMGTLPVAQVFFKMTRKGLSIADIAVEMNHHLVTLMPINMFFSVTLLAYDASSAQLDVWSGGLPESYIIGSGGELRATITSGHPPMGILNDQQFSASLESFPLQSGDRVYLCTDGVVEMVDGDGQEFGADRLLATLQGVNEDRFDHVMQALDAFRGDREQEDDISFIELIC